MACQGLCLRTECTHKAVTIGLSLVAYNFLVGGQGKLYSFATLIKTVQKPGGRCQLFIWFVVILLYKNLKGLQVQPAVDHVVGLLLSTKISLGL